MVDALVTVIFAVPLVVPGFTVIILPDTEQVATFVLLDVQLNAPPLIFLVTVNVPLFGYVYVPLLLDNSNVFPALFIVIAFVQLKLSAL